MKTLPEIIEQIKKLQALSTSSNINEAYAATQAANKLIDKYRLTQADLEDSSTPTIDPIEQDTDYLYTSGRITNWRVMLVGILCHHYGVAHYNDITRGDNGRKLTRLRMVGRKSDMEIVSYMNTWLSFECERLAKTDVVGLGRVSISSYQEGFVSGIKEQLRLSREALRAESSCTAMVKIDSRLQEARTGMYNMVPGLRKTTGSSQRQINQQAFNAGVSRGKSMHLGSNLGSGGGSKLLGK
jgi:hypothetical protein